MNKMRVSSSAQQGDTERLKLFFLLYDNISENENRIEINKNTF